MKTDRFKTAASWPAPRPEMTLQCDACSPLRELLIFASAISQTRSRHSCLFQPWRWCRRDVLVHCTSCVGSKSTDLCSSSVLRERSVAAFIVNLAPHQVQGAWPACRSVEELEKPLRSCASVLLRCARRTHHGLSQAGLSRATVPQVMCNWHHLLRRVRVSIEAVRECV